MSFTGKAPAGHQSRGDSIFGDICALITDDLHCPTGEGMDMGAAFDIEAISGAFAEAALDPLRWPAAMEVVSTATRSYGAMLFDINSHLPGIPRSCAMEPSFDAYVQSGWIDRDVRFRIAPIIVQRGVATDFDILTADQISQHAYYQEFLAHFGLRWFAGGESGGWRRLLVPLDPENNRAGSVRGRRTPGAGCVFEAVRNGRRPCKCHRICPGGSGTRRLLRKRDSGGNAGPQRHCDSDE